MKPAFPGSGPFSAVPGHRAGTAIALSAVSLMAAAALLSGAPALAAQTASGSISTPAAAVPAAAAPTNSAGTRPDPAALPAAAANAAGLAAAATAGPAAPDAAAATPVTPAAVPASPATPEQQAALAGARPAAPIDAAHAPSATGSLLTTIFSLILVLGLLIGLAWLLKRYGPKTITGGANVKLVGALSVGARERILVVEVGEQWIVVGASPGRMNALATMPRQEDASGFAQAGQAGALPGANFAEWFKQTMEKRNSGGSGNNVK